MNWSINDLIQELEYLNQKKDNENNSLALGYLDMEIEMLCNSIFELNIAGKIEGIGKKQIIYAHQVYSSLLKYDEIFNKFLNHSRSLKPYDPYFFEFHNIFKNNNEIMTIISDFFQTLDKELYQAYIKVQIIGKNNYVNNYGGVCITLPTANKIYNQIGLEKNVYSIFSLGHEYGHSISYILQEGEYSINNELIEFESYFIELLLSDYLKTIIKKDVINNLLTLKHKEIINVIYNYNLLATILDIYTMNKYPNFTNLKKLLNRNEIEINTPAKIYSHADDIEENYHYPVGYMTALEVYYIYKQDKELGIHIYKIHSDKLARLRY